MVWLVLLGVLALVSWLYFRFFKIPKIKNITFVDGSLGTGKTFYSVSLACRLHKRALRRYKFALLLSKLPVLRLKLGIPEKPLLISNIPLRGVEFQKLTLEVIERKKRIPHHSVILIDEASLLADQFDWRDKYVSDTLRDFVKLFRHFSHNGNLIFNSQSTSDIHFAFKACLSDYLYIHHKTWLPFFSLLRVQEMVYSADKDGGNVINAFHSDVEDTLKTMLVPNKYFKRYDSLCYSILTDSLEYDKNTQLLEKGDSLKCGDVVTFRKGKYIVRIQEANENGKTVA